MTNFSKENCVNCPNNINNICIWGEKDIKIQEIKKCTYPELYPKFFKKHLTIN